MTPTVLPVSVVVPVRRRAPHDDSDLAACLLALAACDPSAAEIIVVDDGSEPALRLPPSAPAQTRVFRQPPGGPARARNTGATETEHPTLVFIDCDVRVPPDALGRIQRVLDDHRDAGAVWGTVTPTAPDRTFLSRYKNHSHRHFTRCLGAGPGPWPTPHLTSMIVAVRRPAFVAVGGFRADLQTVSVEDVELGRDLVDAGHVVLLDPSLEVDHAHRFTLRGTLKNDAHKLRRLVSATLARPTPAGHSDSPAAQRMAQYRRSAPLAWGAIAATGLGIWPVAAGCWAGFAWSERDFLAYLVRDEGPAFAAAALPWMAIERGTAAVAGLAGVSDYLRARVRAAAARR